MKIKAVGRFMVCKEIEEDDVITKSGLVVPSGMGKKIDFPSAFAVVISKGKDVKTFKIGDKVIYAGQQGHFVKLGTEQYRIVNEEDIVGTLNEK